MAATKLQARLMKQGKAATIQQPPDAFKDWNDVVQGIPTLSLNHLPEQDAQS